MYPIVYLSYTMDLLPKLYTREDLMSCKQVQDFKYVPYSVFIIYNGSASKVVHKRGSNEL